MKLYIQNKLQACKTCNDLPNMYYRVNYEYGTTWSVNENNSDRLWLKIGPLMKTARAVYDDDPDCRIVNEIFMQKSKTIRTMISDQSYKTVN
jgi:hypothetical protein